MGKIEITNINSYINKLKLKDINLVKCLSHILFSQNTVLFEILLNIDFYYLAILFV